MSEESYQKNVDRGVTGPESSTCLLASYDRISEKGEIKPQTYERYNALGHKFVEDVGYNATFVNADIAREFTDLKIDFRRQLMVNSPKNVVEARAENPEELEKKLGQLAQGGFRTSVYLDTGGLHAVGVEQIDIGYYNVKSTWSPFSEGEPVSTEDLFDYLELTPRMRYRPNSSRRTFVAPNIVALPPEPKY
jgi:hypothetical protein